jgi:hypothetical protein
MNEETGVSMTTRAFTIVFFSLGLVGACSPTPASPEDEPTRASVEGPRLRPGERARLEGMASRLQQHQRSKHADVLERVVIEHDEGNDTTAAGRGRTPAPA